MGENSLFPRVSEFLFETRIHLGWDEVAPFLTNPEALGEMTVNKAECLWPPVFCSFPVKTLCFQSKTRSSEMSPLNTHLDSWKQAALFLKRCPHPLKSLPPPHRAGWESLIHLSQRGCPLGYRWPFPAKERGWNRNRWQLRRRLSQLLWPFGAQQLQKYLFSRVWLFCDCSPRWAPLSKGFPRQEYWSGLPFPSPGDLLDPGIESMAPATSPALQVDSWPLSHRGSHQYSQSYQPVKLVLHS